jgi:hypothetical protein
VLSDFEISASSLLLQAQQPSDLTQLRAVLVGSFGHRPIYPSQVASACHPSLQVWFLKAELVDPEKVIFRHMKWSIGSIRALQSE